DRPLALGGPSTPVVYSGLRSTAGALVCCPACPLAAVGHRQRLLQLAGRGAAFQQPIAPDPNHPAVLDRVPCRVLSLRARLSSASLHHLLCSGLACLNDAVARMPAVPHWVDWFSPSRDHRRRWTRGRDHHRGAYGGGC